MIILQKLLLQLQALLARGIQNCEYIMSILGAAVGQSPKISKIGIRGTIRSRSSHNIVLKTGISKRLLSLSKICTHSFEQFKNHNCKTTLLLRSYKKFLVQVQGVVVNNVQVPAMSYTAGFMFTNKTAVFSGTFKKSQKKRRHGNMSGHVSYSGSIA